MPEDKKYRSLRKIGFFVLLYDIFATIVFMYLFFASGNANSAVTPNRVIEEFAGFLSVFGFAVGFLWLLVGSIALILNKQSSGISVTSGGLLLFIAATICAIFYALMVFNYTFPNSGFADILGAIVILTVCAGIIICPAVFFLRKLKD